MPKFQYIEEFLPLASRYPILAPLFTKSSDITSSLATIKAAKASFAKRTADGASSSSVGLDIDHDEYDPSSVLCLVVGEGSEPRTAVVAAIKYGWCTVAIDDKLDEKWETRDTLPTTCNYVGFRGGMDRFLVEGRDHIESFLCDLSNVQHLVIICMDQNNNNFDHLRSLRGRLGIADLRAIYNRSPATVVSLSSQQIISRCPLKLTPRISSIDEGILSPYRQVQVWSFPRCSPSIGSMHSSMSTSSSLYKLNASDGRRINSKSTISLSSHMSNLKTGHSSSKVDQLQRQQALALASKKQLLASKAASVPKQEFDLEYKPKSKVKRRSISASNSLLKILPRVHPKCRQTTPLTEARRAEKDTSVDTNAESIVQLDLHLSSKNPSALTFATDSTSNSSDDDDLNSSTSSNKSRHHQYKEGDFVEVNIGDVYQVGVIDKQPLKGANLYNVTLLTDTPAWKEMQGTSIIYQNSGNKMPEVSGRHIRRFIPAPLGEILHVCVNGTVRKCRVHGYLFDNENDMSPQNMKYSVKFASQDGQGWTNEKYRVPVQRAYRQLYSL